MATMKKLDKSEYSETRRAAEAEAAAIKAKKEAEKAATSPNTPKKLMVTHPKHEKSHGLTIDQTKLGVTLVITKEDCKKMGYKGSDLASFVRAQARKRLGKIYQSSL